MRQIYVKFVLLAAGDAARSVPCRLLVDEAHRRLAKTASATGYRPISFCKRGCDAAAPMGSRGREQLAPTHTHFGTTAVIVGVIANAAHQVRGRGKRFDAKVIGSWSSTRKFGAQ